MKTDVSADTLSINTIRTLAMREPYSASKRDVKP